MSSALRLAAKPFMIALSRCPVLKCCNLFGDIGAAHASQVRLGRHH